MVKYVDSGEGPGPSDKKKMKRLGFKVDRRANFEKMLRKKSGQKEKKTAVSTARPKQVVFDEAALKDYVLSLHKNKNERRVKAFVDMKRKIKKDSAKVRREQREEARKAYNQYARVPILPNYTFKIPSVHEGTAPEDVDEEPLRTGSESEEETDHPVEDPLDSVLEPLMRERRKQKKSLLHTTTVHRMPAAMTEGGSRTSTRATSSVETSKKSARQSRTASTGTTSLESFYAERDTVKDSNGKQERAKKNARRVHNEKEDEDEEAGSSRVTVVVRPLFGTTLPSDSLLGKEDETRQHTKDQRHSPSRLPSNDFSDLPPAVEEELRRLRQQTKGPSRTRAKVHTLKELEKIRKIKRHSRKGHGKKSASGKRKNRK